MATRLRTVLCLQIVQDAVGAVNQDFTCTLSFEILDIVVFVLSGTAQGGTAAIQRRPQAGGGFSAVIGGSGTMSAITTNTLHRLESLVVGQSKFEVGDTIRLATTGGSTRVTANVLLVPDNSNNATST